MRYSRCLVLTLVLFGCTGAAWADRLELVAGGMWEEVGIPAMEARLWEPFGTAFGPDGTLWIVEMDHGNRLLKVDAQGQLTHVAGRPEKGLTADPGPALEAQFNGPHNLAVKADGHVLVADTFNGRIREVDPVAGTLGPVVELKPQAGGPKPGKPFCITLDAAGQYLYVADLRCVWRLELGTGACVRLAGNGQKGVPEDGAMAADAPLVDPRAVAPDALGNVYVLERNGRALRVVDQEGRIRTVVNRAGKKGNTGDGGPALEATMNGPKHLCVDRDNSVIIADAENHVVRRYSPQDGRITRVAGTGQQGRGAVGGGALETALARPHGVTVEPRTGVLYITDSYNDRVLKLVLH